MKTKKMILSDLIIAMSGNTSIQKKFQVILHKFILENINLIDTRANKFIFNKKFFNLFTGVVVKKDVDTKDDNFLYKHFNKLVKYNMVHAKSSCYPKNLRVVSINPNHFSLNMEDFSKLDMFIKARENLITDEKRDFLECIYIYLRYFHLHPLNEKHLEKLAYKDLIIPREHNVVILSLWQKTFIDEESIYRLKILDTVVNKWFFNILEEKLDSKLKIFDDIEIYETTAKDFKKEYLDNAGINTLKLLSKNFNIFNSSPIETTLNAKIISSVELTIQEVDILFPDNVSSALLEEEKKRIDTVFSKPRVDTDEEEESSDKEKEIEYTSIEDLDALLLLLRCKDRKELQLRKKEALLEVERYKDINDSVHSGYIYDYIKSLILRLDKTHKEHIELSTFSQYIWALNKYIFKMVEDITNMKPNEVTRIQNRLDNLMANSYKTRVGDIRRFFTFLKEEYPGFDIKSSMIFYPKSMIFEKDIDKILKTIDKSHDGVNGKNIKYLLLQKKALVLLSFYFGLRKSELHTRLFRDIRFGDRKKELYVNAKGFKKLEIKNLKTKNARRRVEVKIKNPAHERILVSFWEKRKKLGRKDKFLFLDTRKDGRMSSSAIPNTVFDQLNVIIKDVTDRYCTFHSLRHSFATYRIKEIMKNETDTPYALFNLAVQMGHGIPDQTLESYTHWELIKLLNILDE